MKTSLSTALRDALKTFEHSSTTPVNEFFCPVAFGNKGAFWLQAGDVTKNPYFGASMLRCGAKKSTYPAAKEKDKPFSGIRAGDTVLTVVTGPGDDKLVFVLRQNDANLWQVVSEATDY